MDTQARRQAPSLARIMALMCVQNSQLAKLHQGQFPVTRTGDFSDVVVEDADGRHIP